MTRIKPNLGMLVRAKTPDFATLQDMPDLLAVGEPISALTRFRAHPYERARLEKAFTDLITQGQGKYAFLVAANTQGQVVGGFWA